MTAFQYERNFFSSLSILETGTHHFTFHLRATLRVHTPTFETLFMLTGARRPGASSKRIEARDDFTRGGSAQRQGAIGTLCVWAPEPLSVIRDVRFGYACYVIALLSCQSL